MRVESIAAPTLSWRVLSCRMSVTILPMVVAMKQQTISTGCETKAAISPSTVLVCSLVAGGCCDAQWRRRCVAKVANDSSCAVGGVATVAAVMLLQMVSE